MRWFTFVSFVAFATIAESAIMTGRVVDRGGHTVSHARIRAFHIVPLIEYPPPGTWNGLLGETYSDARGYFTLQFTSRASLDYLLAQGAGYWTVIRSPRTSTVRVVLSRKTLSPEEELARLRKRFPPKRPNHAMERTADRSASTF